MKPRVLSLIVAGGLALASIARAAEPVQLTPLADRIRVEIGGQLFTEYIFGDGASRPYCYPVLAPDGTPLTRNFPMKKVEGEETDHPWHRSLFFAHSMVNGVDFWNEGRGDAGHSPDAKGHEVQAELVEVKSGASGVIHTRSRWLAPGDKLICTDDRVLRFSPGPDGRYVDYEITLHALPDAPLVFGDNKDGTMATRLAEWMTMAHKVKGETVGGAGHIVTAKGDRDEDAWGKRADWCDYHAEHNGKTYGVAIFDDPQNLRHPTFWMARNYGLFGANPFGWHEYEKEFKDQPHKGDYTVPAGGSLTLKYRFYYHLGDEKTAQIAERYAEYAAGK